MYLTSNSSEAKPDLIPPPPPERDQFTSKPPKKN